MKIKLNQTVATILAATLSLAVTAGVGGCSKSAATASAPLADATAQSSAQPQRVPIDVGAFTSRVQTTLRASEAGVAQLALSDGRVLQVPAALLPAGASAGNTYILTMTLSDSSTGSSQIERLDPSGQADIATPQGRLSLPASIMPSQSRQQGRLALQIFAHPRPLQSISFDAQVTQVAADRFSVRGADGGSTFDLPRSLLHYPTLQAGDLYRVTVTSDNEPDSGWSGTVTRLERDALILALKAAAAEVRLPSSYAPQAVQAGDFFALTLVKITYQPGDLTASR